MADLWLIGGARLQRYEIIAIDPEVL